MLCTKFVACNVKKIAIRLAVWHLYLVTAEIWGPINKYCENGSTLKSGRNANYYSTCRFSKPAFCQTAKSSICSLYFVFFSNLTTEKCLVLNIEVTFTVANHVVKFGKELESICCGTSTIKLLCYCNDRSIFTWWK